VSFFGGVIFSVMYITFNHNWIGFFLQQELRARVRFDYKNFGADYKKYGAGVVVTYLTSNHVPGVRFPCIVCAFFAFFDNSHFGKPEKLSLQAK
jgi:hypothetical protein